MYDRELAFLDGLAVGLLLAVLATSLILIGVGIADDLPNVEIPRCPEDAVLVGAGEFDEGHWSRYTCGPAVDDFTNYSLP